jgi:ribosomal protein L24E
MSFADIKASYCAHDIMSGRGFAEAGGVSTILRFVSHYSPRRHLKFHIH